MNSIDWEQINEEIEYTKDSYYACGDKICSICGKPYTKHPLDKKYQYLNVLCNGDLVKL